MTDIDRNRARYDAGLSKTYKCVECGGRLKATERPSKCYKYEVREFDTVCGGNMVDSELLSIYMSYEELMKARQAKAAVTCIYAAVERLPLSDARENALFGMRIQLECIGEDIREIEARLAQ